MERGGRVEPRTSQCPRLLSLQPFRRHRRTAVTSPVRSSTPASMGDADSGITGSQKYQESAVRCWAFEMASSRAFSPQVSYQSRAEQGGRSWHQNVAGRRRSLGLYEPLGDAPTLQKARMFRVHVLARTA